MPSYFVQPVQQAMRCRPVSLKKSLVMLLCLLLFNLSLGCLQSWASVLMLTDANCHAMQSTTISAADHSASATHAQSVHVSIHQADRSSGEMADVAQDLSLEHINSLPSADTQNMHDMQHHCLASCSLFLQAPQLQPLSELRFSLQPTAQSCAHLATPLQGCLSNPERPPQLIS